MQMREATVGASVPVAVSEAGESEAKIRTRLLNR